MDDHSHADCDCYPVPPCPTLPETGGSTYQPTCIRCPDPYPHVHLDRTGYAIHPPPAETILQEAERLVNGARQGDYGHPLDDFSKTAKIWGAILGTEVTPEQVALCMVGVKISREAHRHKRDSLVDMIGYVLTLDMLIEERERRGS